MPVRPQLKPIAVDNPQAAYNLLIETRFDLIFLDVDMPGMNGFELCSKLRMLPPHKLTPVVFVTSLNDLESRANSTMSGGNDLIQLLYCHGPGRCTRRDSSDHQ